MTSRSASENSIPFAQVIELINIYSFSAQVVQRPLSDIYRILAEKRSLTQRLCISLLDTLRSLLDALEEMRSPLLHLCSAFETLAQLPGTLVPFHIEIFTALREIQNQAQRVESCTKKCHEYIVASAFPELFDIRMHTIEVIKLFRAKLSRVNTLLRRVLEQKKVLSQSQRHPLSTPEGSKNIPRIASLLGDRTQSSKLAEVSHQIAKEDVDGSAMEKLEQILNTRNTHLLEIERKKTEFLDPRNVPRDLIKEEEAVRNEIQRISHEIDNLSRKSVK